MTTPLTHPGAHSAPPPRIVLATDLAPRCDRAITRAARIAADSGLPLLAVHVVASDSADQDIAPGAPAWYSPVPARRQADALLRDLLAEHAVQGRVQVLQGNPAQALLPLLEPPGPALVVTGPVRAGLLATMQLGSTVDRLLRRPATGVLVTRTLAPARRGGYRHLLVASDYSERSKAALLQAHAWFPEARITLLHAAQLPYAGLASEGRERAIGALLRQQQDAGAAFLDQCGLPAAARTHLELFVEHGDAAALVRQYALTYTPDLVVAGTHGHGALYETLIGSVARRIAAQSPIDTLVIRL